MPNEMTAAEIADELDLEGERHNERGELHKAHIHIAAANIVRQYANGELKPVVHGHWHENWNYINGQINRDCSVCHGRTNEYTPTPICPWCGALMDGKDDSHEHN